MSDETPAPIPPAPVLAEASAWLARHDRGLTSAEAEAFSAWLRHSPVHAQAWQQVNATWTSLDGLRNDETAVPLRPMHPRRLARPVRWLAAAGVAAAAAMLAATVLTREPWSALPLATTSVPVALPEYRVERLPDGSRVERAPGTEIATEFSPGERRVLLQRGAARFDVVDDPARPFVVLAGQVSVRAVGTVFDVSLQRTGVEVRVTEGKVRVEREIAPSPSLATAAATPPPTELTAGQRATIVVDAQNSAAPKIETVSAEERERPFALQPLWMEFDGLTLGAVVQAFNHHNTTQITIRDPQLEHVQLGGAFRTDNLEGFLRLLESSVGVHVERHDRNVVLSSKP